MTVNGERLGEVKHDGTITLDLPPGSHRIKMTIDWCSSQEIVVEGDEDAELICQPGSSAFMALLDIIFRSNGYIMLERSNQSAIPASKRPS
ncbi:MAG: hypothetical protein ABJ205_14450 [Erythrobacter sp.]|uniref:hypothetical protein n=1 Tax=Erythrobacter sp. TaxID=1042 RepID=UPI003265B837